MKGKARIFARKAFALLIATAMSMPTATLAAENEIKIYDQNSSVMGLADNTENQKETKLLGDNSVQKETDSYKIDMRARFDDLDKIIYEVKISKKLTDDQNAGEVKAAQDINLNFTPNPNSSIKNLKLLSAKALSPQGSKEIAFEENTNKSDLEGLKLKGAIEDEIVLELAADVRQAEKSRTYDMDISLFVGEDKANISYNLIANKEIIKEEDKEIEKISLDLNDKESDNLKGEIESSDIFGLLSKKETISWTNYLANDDKDAKEVSYEFNLDDKQDTTDTKINIDYYENTVDGYILKNEFSQAIDFAKKIEFEIPANYIAKMSLKTKVDKNNTEVKAYSLNNRQVKNPSYKEEEKTPADDDEEDHQADSKTEEKPSQTGTENQDKKEDQDIKIDDANNEAEKESDTGITVTDSNGEEVPVEIKENTEEETQVNEEDKISALILNKDSLLAKLEAENNLDQIKKAAIEDLANDLDSYNDEKITQQELFDFIKKLRENYNIDKTDLRFFIESILSGLNKQTNKATNLNIDEILGYAYPEDTNEKAENKSEENNVDKKEEKSQGEQAEKTQEENLPADKTEKETTEEKKDPSKIFDEDLAKLKDAANKEEEKSGVLDNLKSLMGLTDLAKADKELKAALADESKTLEEIQNLLNSFETKYNLSKADQAKLMDDNGDAIKALVEKHKDSKTRLDILMDISPEVNSQAVGAGRALTESEKSNLEGKKFNIITRFDTSNATGPIQPGQFFNIHLDNQLKVKDVNSLHPLEYNGKVITDSPTYDSAKNILTYKIKEPIAQNIQVPVVIPVDYNTANIKLDDDGTFTVINKVSGLGLINPPKDLVPQKVDKNGNPAGSIIEPGRDDVTQIIEPDDSNYKITADADAYPVIENGELTGYNWVVKVTSDTDLSELGYKANFTTVKGSGLGEIKDVRINEISTKLTDQLSEDYENGIVDSKHHSPESGVKDLTYTFFTPRTNKQEKYMMDFSVILTKRTKDGKPKVGAKRIVIDEGWPIEKVREATPTRVGMNNRTTVLGEFASEEKVKWTVTDAISTGDTNTTLPLEDRKIDDIQDPQKGTYVYRIDEKTGQMVRDKSINITVTNIPNNSVGTIAVYEIGFPIKDKKQTLAGVTVSKYQDIYVDQNWNLPDGQKMPAQTITVTDKDGNKTSATVSEGPVVSGDSGKQRFITVPDVKYWDIDDKGNATFRDHTISQTFPEDKVTIGTKEYKYSENANYFRPDTRIHYIQNSLDEDTDKKPATFTVIKLDSNNPDKRVAGANFDLLGADVSITTDANGEATFRNIRPGTYWLKETKAPEGYKLDQSEKTIIISDQGEITVSGQNAKLSTGSGKTEIVEHSDYPEWPDYMNTMHYGKLDANGNLEFYIYLKPYGPRKGGRTDKDTRLDISIPGVTLTNDEVKVYDLDPTYRQYYYEHMENQKMNEAIVYNDVTGVANNNGAITGTANYKDPYTGKTGYSIFFPEKRFGTDWGFLVKVTADVGSNKDSATISYDWLADKNTATNSKIQEIVNISTNPIENGPPTITIANEPFEKSPIEVVKFDQTFTTKTDSEGNEVLKRDRLPGAEFVLKDANGNPISNKFTGESGKVNFGDFPPGTYYLEEKVAPAGYEKSDVYFEVTVSEIGEVTYKAKFKTLSGTPVAGEDYFIEQGEETSSGSKATVLEVHQQMDVKDSGRGFYQGIWEAYELESLKYKLDARLNIAGPGTRFEIQFDKNLDFTQYFTEFPDLVKNGQVIAKPYFDHDTKLLTYVFTENAAQGETTISLNLVGMIPSKYYAKTHGEYKITNVVAPGQTVTDPNSNQIDTINVWADFGDYDAKRDSYHKPKSNPPSQVYYFREVYQDDKGDWYVTALAYYNPLGLYSGASKDLRFNWMSTSFQSDKIQHFWEAKGNLPAFQLENVKVYRTDKSLSTVKNHKNNDVIVSTVMPLSMGIRPDQDPYTYRKVFETNINPDSFKSASSNDVYLEYDPSEITKDAILQQKAPLKMTMPKISSAKEGYVIEQTFKIPDIDKFNENWRAFYMGQNTELRSTFITGPNKNYSNVDQTGQEIPKFYKEEVGIINKKYTPGQFKITKTANDTGSTLQGAEFVLKDSTGKTIYRSSNSNGLVEFNNLPPGRYTLKESKAPEGYIGTNETWDVIVQSDGTVRIEESSITGSGTIFTGNNEKIINIPVENRKVGENFQVYKKGENGKALAGATFTITKQGETTPTGTATSSANGTAEFTANLTEGTYIIEETNAPNGYKKLDKKWVLVVDKEGKKKIYNYSPRTDSDEKSLLGETGTYFVNVKERPQDSLSADDNRKTGWTGNSVDAEHLGTRIIAINKEKKYVIQRYIINPEAKQTVGVDGTTSATIHREKPEYPNMDWYNSNNQNNDYKVFTLEPKAGGNSDGKVTGLVSDFRLSDYTTTDITDSVKESATVDTSHYGETRLKLSLPETNKPIVVDVKVPYNDENGGVGTGMDWRENNVTYWKSDYYEKVSDIVLGDTFASEIGTIEGSYIGENSLEVANEAQTYGFKIKKVKEGAETQVVPGATFKLTGPDDSQNERFMTTGKDGLISFNGLKPGTYKLEETEPAPGYEKANTTWTIRVTTDAKVYIKDNSQNPNPKNSSFTVSTAEKSATNNLMRRLQMAGANTELEISGNLVDTLNPLRAGDGWEQVDNASSIQPEKKEDASSDYGQLIDTKIIEIDKDNNRYKQVFIYKQGGTAKRNREIKFHRAHDAYNISPSEVTTRVFQVPDGTSIANINGSSDIDKIANKTDISSKVSFDSVTEGVNKIKTTSITTRYPGTILIEVETNYNENQPIGLGSNYNFNMAGQYGNKCWLEKSYANEAGVPVVKTTVDYTITFDGNGGQWHMDPVTVEDGTEYELPGSSFVAPDGKEFDGWLVNGQNKNPGDKITVTSDLTIQAQWRDKAPEQATVSFSPGKGSGSMAEQKVNVGSNYQLPANRFTAPEGNEFKAWSVNGVEYQPGASITVNADTIITALWKDKAPETHNVIVPKPQQEGGTITAEPTSATAGTPINLTVTPNKGYEIESVTMNGETLTAGPDGKYSFTMPARDATVSATFKKSEPQGPEAGETEIPSDGFAQITNKQTGLDLRVLKVNSLNRNLPGAEFTIEKYKDGDYKELDDTFKKATGISDENGVVEFKDENDKKISLPIGHYLLTETKSPSGYVEAQAPWKVEVYEENGQLKARYKGAEDTPQELLNSNKANDKDALTTTDNGIKYKSRLTYINTESKTYIQRIYIDTRGYTGTADKINVQITPKYKRDETDEPGKLPVTNIEGVKTAYRSTYKISEAGANPNVDDILRYYDLSEPNVTMLNTARWRPFDWGFDEDLLNIEKGVYYIDVEGFYDDAIITGIDKHLKDAQGNPTDRTKLDTNNKNYIDENDLGKIDLNIDFHDGERKFQQVTGKDASGNPTWSDGTNPDDAYLLGNIGLGYVEKDENGENVPTEAGKVVPAGAKYPLWVGKAGGRIDPPLSEGNKTRVSTSIDIKSLYSSETLRQVSQEGMSITNDEETYNITFSKHGRDNPDYQIDGEEVTQNRLEGGIFKLQEDNGITFEDVEGSYVASAFNGYFGFRGLKPGRYRLMEVKAPKGYVPIKDPLLYFSVETITTSSGKIVDPLTGNEVDIKSIKVKFPKNDTIYELSNLQMVDPDNPTKTVAIKDIESKKIDIETAQIIDPKNNENKVLLKDLKIPGDGTDYAIKDTKVVDSKSGYISLEYDKANGVYQYVPEKSTNEKDGKLIDYVTSATAKNMGKIINEKPGEGSINIKKVDQKGNAIEASNLLPGAEFKLTNLSNGENKTGIVGADGTLKFENLQIGNYRLVETKSPNGYINANQIWNFTVGGEGLDPYAGPIERTGDDLSNKITLETTKMEVLNPQKEDNTAFKEGEIHPHRGESMEFTNKFTLAPDIKINPGDYFTLNVSDNIDLNGIFEHQVGNLDIIAGGIGTIAKADYDRKAGTITYTFTEYAKTYTLIEFSNKLTAFIDLYKVTSSDQGSNKQKVGFGIGKDTGQYKDIKVVYDLDYAKGAKYNNTYNNWDQLNMVSKIVHYNQETGEFVHYYYINRKGEYSNQLTEFWYKPRQDIENLNISAKQVTGEDINTAMPESFGIDNQSGFEQKHSQTYLEGGGEYLVATYFPGEAGLGNSKWIIKVTGRVAGDDKSEYYAQGALVKYYNDGGDLGVERYDEIYAFKNEAKATANLEIQVVNPENEINFKKVDLNGSPLQGAKFKHFYRAKDTDSWTQLGQEITTGANGEFSFTKLKPGKHKIEETQAPEGYKIDPNSTIEFEVDRSGKITRKVTSSDGKTTTTEDVTGGHLSIVNKKEHEIEFKKVDPERKALAGAEFEVWYKAGKSGEYTKDKLKLYQDELGNKLVLKVDEKAPKGFTEVQKFISGEDGLVKFKFFEQGYYALKEIKAPSGYIKGKGDYAKEFALIDGKVQEEKYKTTMEVTKSPGYFYANGLHDVYNTDITMRFNPEYEKITYEQGKAKLTLSGLPLNNEYYENNIGTKTGITISAKLVNINGDSSSTKTYNLDVTKNYTNDKGTITIDLYELVKELEKKNDASITSENTIEFSMYSSLRLNTTLDINSKIEIGDGKDKISEERIFKIGTEGDKKVDHSYSFDTMGELDAKGSIEIVNKKGSLPNTNGLAAWIGYTLMGLVVMVLAGFYYNKKKTIG